MDNLNKSEILCKIIQSFLLAVEKKTSRVFTINTIDFILNNFHDKYNFTKYITVDGRSSDKLIIIKIEDVLDIQNATIIQISEFLEEVCGEIFKSILQNESYYNLDLDEIAENIRDEVDYLLDELGIKIRWRFVTKGAISDLKKRTKYVSLTKFSTKSQILNPLINNMIDIVYEGMLKKGKKRGDATKVIIDSMRELEREHDTFKFMLIEDFNIEKINYKIRTKWKIEDVLLSGSNEKYNIDVVSKIDLIDNDAYAKAVQEFIIKVGSHINIQDRPYFIPKLITLMGENSLNKFPELDIDMNEIEKIFSKQGYNEVVEKTLEVLIELIGSKTSTSFAVTALNTILEKLKDRDESVLRHIRVDTSLYEKGIEAFIINPDLNKEAPYAIAKTLTHILKLIQDNRENRQDKVNFIQDFKRELGERYFLELENLGVNVNIINLRYV